MSRPRTSTALGAAVAGALLVTALPAMPAQAASSWVPSRCKHGRVVCIDKTTRTLRLMVNGRTKIKMAARFGAARTPTREGTFRVYWKDLDHVSRLFGSAMPYSMFFSGGQAIHYSSDFAARGYYGASHGCVNTRNWSKMRSLFRSVSVGDKVIIYRS